jgi:PAS domain S-box-containing protein
MMAANEDLRTNFVSGGGEMGRLIGSFRWEDTSLGDLNTWSQSLRTSVNLILNSTQPMWLSWGKEGIFIYNDSYVEVLGLAKHPWALGKPAHVVWSEIWDFCGPLSDKVYQEGKASFINDVHFFMNRGNDFLEEVFYSFSYSPIYDETGAVGGLFCPNMETTPKLINERRLKTLSDLSSTALLEKTIESALQKAAETIKKNREDIPFATFYVVDPVGHQAVLKTSTGLTAPAFPNTIDLNPEVRTDEAGVLAKVAEVIRTGKTNVVGVDEMDKLPFGLANQKIKEAIVLPLIPTSVAAPVGAIIAGINPTRKLDEEYRTFFDLIAGQLSTAYQNAVAAESDRKRAEMLAEINAAKTTFFSNISHEFRTPLTLMLGPLEELLRRPEGNLGPQERQNIEITHRNAMRLLKLVNSLLDFSRLESGRSELQFQRVDLAGYTADLAAGFRSVMEQAGLTYTVSTGDLVQPVYVDKGMWEKIVLNLLSNAFKYTLGGAITIRLFSDGKNAILTVQDTGVGIPEKELPHMFERFHRVKNSAGRSYEGTGIGLSLVNELVNLHGGSIKVTSTEGSGSTFTVSLPLGSQHLPAEKIVDQPAAFLAELSETFISEAATRNHHPQENGSIVTDDASPRPHLLIVDDNADMLAYISRLLQGDYHITTATHGKEALESIKRQEPDLVLSDIMMPVMDGIQLLKAVKEDQRTRNLPVILLSARAGEESRIEGYEIGADDYLVKPFSAKELVARIRSQLKIAHSRKLVERSESQFRNMVQQAPTGICILRGPDHIVEVANDRIMELWGRRPEQVMNKPVFQGLPEAKDQGFDLLLKNVYTKAERLVAEEIPISLKRNGQMEDIYVKFVYEPLADDEGHTYAIMVVADEITAQVKARKIIEESEQHLENLVDERTRELVKANKELESFNYIASHDLQEPLRKIQTFSGLLQQNKSDVKFTETYLGKISAAANRMSELIQSVLAYSKLSSTDVVFTETDLNTVLENVITDFEVLIEEKHAGITSDRLPVIPAIPLQMNQLFSNLISNALKFSRERPVIKISAVAAGNNVRITVSDNGIGFEPQYQEKIFNLFQRLHGRQEYSGTGVGLTICKKIVERHNGSISAEPNPGGGASFIILLPAGPAPADPLTP